MLPLDPICKYWQWKGAFIASRLIKVLFAKSSGECVEVIVRIEAVLVPKNAIS